jgi:hypothetical protein
VKVPVTARHPVAEERGRLLVPAAEFDLDLKAVRCLSIVAYQSWALLRVKRLVVTTVTTLFAFLHLSA